MSTFLKPSPGPQLNGRHPESVTRRYRPESAAMDELVDALYQLLMDAPVDASGTTSPPSEIGLLSGGARVRNVS
jgi:hypothetical protein